VAAGCLVAYVTGVALGYPELLVVAVAGLASLAVAAAAVVVRPRLEVTRRMEPTRVRVGQPVLATLTARNLARWRSPGFVAVDRVGGTPVELPVRSIGGRARQVVRYPLATTRRGRFAVGPVTVERRDPLGLLSRAQAHGAADTLWVHPRVHPMAPLPVGVQLDYEGAIVDTAPRGSLTFSSLREYVPGDDPRQVHWKSTARTGTLIVKEHVDTSQPTTTVVLDTRARVWDGDAFEQAVEVAASVVTTAERAGRPVALHLCDEDVAAAGVAGAVSLLDRLAAVRTSPAEAPGGVVAAVELAQPGGALVVVTGTAEPGLVSRLVGQRRRFAPVVLVRVDGAGGGVATSRQAGMVLIRAALAADVAGTWNQLVSGRRSA
jgi:uncharacterized protein (DUF58 family)